MTLLKRASAGGSLLELVEAAAGSDAQECVWSR